MIPNAELTLQEYINAVLSEARSNYWRWRADLQGTWEPTQGLGLRWHAIPSQESLLERRDQWARFFGKDLPRHPRPSTKHLEEMTELVYTLRGEMGLDVFRGLAIPWVEKYFVSFEQLVVENMKEKEEAFFQGVDDLHGRAERPSLFELDLFVEDYLDLWVLASLLKVESDLFLSGFPLKGAHRERLWERQETQVNGVADCRIALVRITHPRYRW